MSLLPIVDILKILAESGAASWALFPLELGDVVDPLQGFAERTGLVAGLGQDRVQRILSDAFVPYRKLAKIAEPEAIPLQPESDPAPAKRVYRTPRATIEAFWHVVRNENSDYLVTWLQRHPLDAPYLHKLWKSKCPQT